MRAYFRETITACLQICLAIPSGPLLQCTLARLIGLINTGLFLDNSSNYWLWYFKIINKEKKSVIAQYIFEMRFGRMCG